MFRRKSLRQWAIASTGIVAALLLVQGTSLAGETGPASPQYFKPVALCARAQPGHAGCFAMKLERVSASAPGARARPSAIRAGFPLGLAGGYTPGDIAKAYGVNPAASVSQTVAIVDAYSDPTARADLSHFDSHYGLPAETATSLRIVNQTGGASLPTGNTTWAGEISLDLDAVRGLCNKCKIVLVLANTSNFSDLAVAENTAAAMAGIVSNSYGGAESNSPASATLQNAYKHPGKVILASAGDNGMFDWDFVNNSSHNSNNAPEQPSSFNTVVAVGGTSLFLNADATRSSEVVWNENGSADGLGLGFAQPLGATGGGCSKFYAPRPAQASVAKYSETTCGTKRLANDVSAIADPYTGFDTYNTTGASGWGTIGGTSLASPVVAALWALAGGSGGVQYPANSLYKHFKSAPGTLFDVTGGGNGICDAAPAYICAQATNSGNSPNTAGAGILDCAWKGTTNTLATGRRECDAAVGYDGPTGVGTPKGLGAFKP